MKKFAWCRDGMVESKAGNYTHKYEFDDFKNAIIKLIEDEPEYPGEMPNHIFQIGKINKDNMAGLFRQTVKLTKVGIIARIKALDGCGEIETNTPNCDTCKNASNACNCFGYKPE